VPNATSTSQTSWAGHLSTRRQPAAKPARTLPLIRLSTVTEIIFINEILLSQCESKKSPLGYRFFIIFQKRLRIFNRFSTHLIHVPMYAIIQIFIQLPPTLTKLCHIKRDYLVHIMCAKCPPSAKTLAFRRLRKSLIALLIIFCGKSL